MKPDCGPWEETDTEPSKAPWAVNVSVNVSDSGCGGSVVCSRCALPFANACWEKAVAAMTLNGNELVQRVFWLVKHVMLIVMYYYYYY